MFYIEQDRPTPAVTVPMSAVPASAAMLWTQRHNPPWLDAQTLLAAFRRSDVDPSIWESLDGRWTAALKRARRGQHVYLCLWRDGDLLGTYDAAHRWRWVSARTRVARRAPANARQLAFAS